MALISDATKGNMAGDPRSSRYISPAVGSGSRPTPSKVKIESSAPDDPHTLGRDVAGSLK